MLTSHNFYMYVLLQMENLMDLAMNLADGSTAHNLKECNRNFDRICLINNILLMRREENKFNVPKEPKNNQKSESFRLLGNQLFSRKKWFGALECYNKSICFAVKNSEQLSIGYANRSAIYFELKQYTLCLENIAYAKGGGLPDRLMNKLNKREGDCLSLMENEGGDPNIYQLGKEEVKLSRKAHPKVPFIDDCLEMKTNIYEGRHIITNADLKPGQIIAIENSFVHGIYEDFNYRRCTYCTKENMLSLIPCDDCTNTMFCSECANEAVDDFHKFECPITDFLASFQQTRFVLRLVIRAIEAFSSTEDMIDFIEESPEYTIFSCDQNEELSAKQKYLQVHSLSTNEEKQSEMDLLFRSIYSTILYQQLVNHTVLKDMLSLDTIEGAKVALADIIYHSFLIIPQNGHILSSRDAKEIENIGGAIYPFASLINHSCSPNVFRISCGTKIVIVVLRNIKKGEQLYDCYT